MSSDFPFDRSMKHWHMRKLYLAEHYRDLDGVRFRPTGAPPQTVHTSSGPLVFTTSARVHGLECRVNEAPGDATVGNAIDELLTLRYSQGQTTDTAERGRVRVRQRVFGPRKSPEELEAADDVWRHYRRTLQGWLPTLRGDVVEAVYRRMGIGRHGMVLALHAAAARVPELVDSPEHRHSRLVTASLRDLLDLADPDEITAVAGMLDLATRALPAPSQLTRSIARPRCGHGEADLLLDGTLIEVKSGRNTQTSSVLTGEVIHQLLGYVLSVEAELEELTPVTRAGWYLARYGVLWDFPIEDIPSLVYGRTLSLEVARKAFRRGVPPAEVA